MDLTRLRLAVLLLTVLNACQSPRTATNPIVPRPTSTQPLTPTPGLAPSAIPGSAVARLRVASINEEMPDNRTLLTTFQYDSEGRLSRLITRQTPDRASATVERSYNSRISAGSSAASNNNSTQRPARNRWCPVNYYQKRKSLDYENDIAYH